MAECPRHRGAQRSGALLVHTAPLARDSQQPARLDPAKAAGPVGGRSKQAKGGARSDVHEDAYGE